jgi:hypothetical protein
MEVDKSRPPVKECRCMSLPVYQTDVTSVARSASDRGVESDIPASVRREPDGETRAQAAEPGADAAPLAEIHRSRPC